MESRTKFLITILAVAFFAMGLFLFSWKGGSFAEVAMFTIFGIALVGAAFLGVKAERRENTKPGIVKIIFASFALAFALLMLGSLVSMVLWKDSSFDLMFGPYSGVTWLVTAAVLSPFVYSRLR